MHILINKTCFSSYHIGIKKYYQNTTKDKNKERFKSAKMRNVNFLSE